MQILPKNLNKNKSTSSKFVRSNQESSSANALVIKLTQMMQQKEKVMKTQKLNK